MTATEPSKKIKAKKPAKKKLTLSLNEELIKRGKALAKEQGVSLSKLVEQFIEEQLVPVMEPVIIIEPAPDILALMGKSTLPSKRVTNREYYDDYAKTRYERYVKNSVPE